MVFSQNAWNVADDVGRGDRALLKTVPQYFKKH